MAERKIYPGGLVKAFGVPDVSFPQYEEQVRGMTNLVQKINAVNTFALGQLTEVAKKEGHEYAADNQINLTQYLNADAIEKNKLIGGDDLTVAGKTIRAAQINFLSTEVEIEASSKFTALKIQAVANDMPIADYKMALDALVDGYTDALMEADAEAALQLKAKLASTAHSYLASYSDRTLKNALTEKSNKAIIFAYEEIDRISDIIIEGSKTLPVAYDDPEEKFIDVDGILSFKKLQIQHALAPYLTSGEIKAWGEKWDTAVIKAKKDVIYDWVDQPNNFASAKAAKNTYNEVFAGTFKGDINMQRLFNSLDEVDQRAIVTKVKTWNGDVYEKIEKEEEAFTLDIQKQIETWEYQFATYELENNYLEAEKLLKKIVALAEANPEYKPLATKYMQLLESQVDSSKYLDHDTLVDLQEDLIMGTLTYDEIHLAWTLHKIGKDEYKDLAFKFQAKKKTSFMEAEKYIKNAVGYADATIIQMRSADDKAFQRYRLATNDLMDFYKNNPGVSPDDLLLKAKELLAVHTDAAATDILIAETKKELFHQDGFFLKSRLWTAHFKQYLEEGDVFEPISITLNTVEGTTKIRDQIDDLLEVPIDERPHEISDEKLHLLLEKIDQLIGYHG